MLQLQTVFILALTALQTICPVYSYNAWTKKASSPLYNNAMTRKSFFASTSSMLVAVGSTVSDPKPSFAASDDPLPSVTFEEFEKILISSARSIQIVEFSGAQGTRAVVKLIDGTTFTVSGLIESPTDPRSPLKLVATCRNYGVPTKNLELEALVSKGKKRKVYLNPREQEAARKEKEKKDRMAKDEEERLAALYKLQEEEAMKLETESVKE